MEKISGIYAVTNKITGERYVGSSKNVEQRWKSHKDKQEWRRNPGMKLYQAFQEYGVENFSFSIVCLVEPEHLREVEQEVMENFEPTYNKNNAKRYFIYKGNKFGTERGNRTEYQKEYQSQPCNYKGETVSLGTLTARFRKQGVDKPYLEAKKYLIK